MATDIEVTSAQYIKGVGPDRLRVLKRLGISTIKDCLWYFPRRYEDRSDLRPISSLKLDEFQTIKGRVMKSSIFRTRKGMTIFQLTVGDETGTISCLWFHQPYMKRYFKQDDSVILYGKVQKNRGLQIIHPEYEIIRPGDDEHQAIHTARIVPIYPLVSGVNQRMLRGVVKNALQQYASLVEDPMPTNIRARNRLLGLDSAVKNIHFPVNERQRQEARKRLVFDEFFLLQMALAVKRYKMRSNPDTRAHSIDASREEEFFKTIGFELTDAQKKTIEDIRKDMTSSRPMHRLVQGEVGSGKTVVSAYGLFLAAANNRQGAIMVPTEILARQHYLTLNNIFASLGYNVVLLINGMNKDEKHEVVSQIQSKEADIIVGTHTLIQKGISFKDLGVVVVDEQHKFGVEQRSQLKTKTQNPDILVMTATPIPRTMAMTLYGDMDISVIDELPQGPRDVSTLWIDSSRVHEAYAFVKEQISAGRQAYIVYPVIDESVSLRSEGAEKMYEKLRNEAFKGLRVGLIHARMKDDDKSDIMKMFKKTKIDILVATTIIEVGIDVPNASVMVIENAERFGLSQLHQLRGRIGRGKFRSYCILVSDARTEESRQRLEVISKTEDGFRIAEEDLNMRGPGELFGKRQHGLPQLNLGNVVEDVDLLKQARQEAFRLIAEDPQLKDERHAGLRDLLLEAFQDRFHLGSIG